MRRSLILTVAAVVSAVLLAMLVPMGALVRSYAQEDLLLRASLEVQATETVVSGQDRGAVSVYLDRLNRDSDDTGVVTTVIYPDGTAVGPDPRVDDRVRNARRTGQARVDDLGEVTQLLVPVSLGGSSPLPQNTPVIRVSVEEPGLVSSVGIAWAVLAVLGLLLFAGALWLADRLGRSFVAPLRTLADSAQGLGRVSAQEVSLPVTGPPEVQDLARALNRLVGRVGDLLDRERETSADLSHRVRTPVTALRLGIERLPDPRDRARLEEDLLRLEQLVDQVVAERELSGSGALVPECDAAAVVAERGEFWAVLAEDQERAFDVEVADGPLIVGVPEQEVSALVDVLLDNAFSHTAEGAGVRLSVAPWSGGAVIRVEDAGAGLPADLDVTARGVSGAGSTGLGLAIARRTAEESGGELVLGRSDLGGALVEARLGGLDD